MWHIKNNRSIVRGFKIGVTKWFRLNAVIYTIWQRNYYEHIIRNDVELNKNREYIINNKGIKTVHLTEMPENDSIRLK